MIRFLALAARRRLPRRAFGPARPAGVRPGCIWASRVRRSRLARALLGSARPRPAPRRLSSFPRPGAGGFRPGPARPPRPAPRRR